jgi:hypothetical protein
MTKALFARIGVFPSVAIAPRNPAIFCKALGAAGPSISAANSVSSAIAGSGANAASSARVTSGDAVLAGTAGSSESPAPPSASACSGLSASVGVATSRALALRCRPITSADLEAIVHLLKKGCGRQRSRRFWQRMLIALGNRPTPAGMPQYGYLMEAQSRPVGVLLALSSTIHAGTTTFVRCNLSSWYVEPEFRPYGSL